MKIIANTNDKQFFVSINEQELRWILGITDYPLTKGFNVNESILKGIELPISNNYQNAERIKNIVKREAFKNAKANLEEAIKILDDAENKFTNLKRTIEQ